MQNFGEEPSTSLGLAFENKDKKEGIAKTFSRQSDNSKQTRPNTARGGCLQVAIEFGGGANLPHFSRACFILLLRIGRARRDDTFLPWVLHFAGATAVAMAGLAPTPKFKFLWPAARRDEPE